MRIFRSLALALVVGAAYFAQAIWDRGALSGFFPDRLLGASPFLLSMTRWLPQDVFAFAAWLAVVSALGFGLLSPLWRGEWREEDRRTRGRARPLATSARNKWAAVALTAGAWLCIGAATAGIRAVGMSPVLSNWLWLSGIALYMAGGYFAAPRGASSRPCN